MDGSSRAFVQAIQARGLRAVEGEARAIRILKTIEVIDKGRIARLEPCDGFEIDFAIDFAETAIGVQEAVLSMAAGDFAAELMECRTFCRKNEVDALQKMGLARGGSLDNAIVVDGGEVLNPEGLRRPDEFVRHKMLDVVGDLALAGSPIIGRYVGRKAGHEMTNKLLRALFAAPEAWCFDVVETDAAPTRSRAAV
jgi:UDP-3-O-[3-hydroxymyristoyl] N-acetylglucosamine deacetylase